jgi:hypothetical protein
MNDITIVSTKGGSAVLEIYAYAGAGDRPESSLGVLREIVYRVNRDRLTGIITWRMVEMNKEMTEIYGDESPHQQSYL